MLALVLAAGCVTPRAGDPALPGFPVAAPGGARGPEHLQRLVELGPDRVVLAERIDADGRPAQTFEVVVDRFGAVQERRPRAEMPEAPAGGRAFPLPLDGDLRLTARRDDGAWALALEGADARVVLARVPRNRDVSLGPAWTAPGSAPTLAVVAWRSVSGAIRVEGLQILDLVRGRARVAAAAGHAARRAGRPEEALVRFRRAFGIDPTHADAAYDAAAVLARLGRPEESLDWLGRALALDRDRMAVRVVFDGDFEALRADPRFRELVGPGAGLPAARPRPADGSFPPGRP